jgi:ubiquitin-conjugating enzyme E2 D/E
VWKATIAGPEGTAFADGTFSAIITFPTDYPFKPPRFQVVTRVYHPNINQNGGACLDILKDSWSPALTASRVLSAFVDLLERPVLEDPLRPDVAILYRNDYPTFYRRAREMTERYAMPQAGLGRDTSATPEPMPLPRTPAQDHHLHVSKHARRLSDMEQRDRGTRLAPLELPPLDAAIHVATGGRRQSLAHAVTMNLS